MVVPTGTGGSNTSGISNYSLVIQAASGTLSGSGYTNVSNYLLAFGGTNTTATVPYWTNSATNYYGALRADHSGNLWAVLNGLASPNNYQTSSAIVKFPNAASATTGLAPTTVIPLPGNVSVDRIAIDSNNNLWIDEIDLSTPNTGAARIVQYTAASNYASIGIVIPYSGNGGNSGGCEGARMAFGLEGHLHTMESYSNGSGSCSIRVREYTSGGVAVASKYYPAGYNGSNYGDIAIDAAGNLWVFPWAQNCSSASPASCSQPARIYKVNSAGVLLQTITLPNVQEAGGAVFDANGNLWFGGNVSQLDHCSGSLTQYLYELPPGSGTPTVAFTHTGSCTSPLTYYFGLAVNPKPPNLP